MNPNEELSKIKMEHLRQFTDVETELQFMDLSELDGNLKRILSSRDASTTSNRKSIEFRKCTKLSEHLKKFRLSNEEYVTNATKNLKNKLNQNDATRNSLFDDTRFEELFGDELSQVSVNEVLK